MEFQLKVRFLTKQGAPMKHTKQYTKDYFQQSGKFVVKKFCAISPFCKQEQAY